MNAIILAPTAKKRSRTLITQVLTNYAKIIYIFYFKSIDKRRKLCYITQC